MNEIKFSCVHCSQHLEAANTMAGERIECPACKQMIVIPVPPSPAKRDTVRIPVPKKNDSGVTQLAEFQLPEQKKSKWLKEVN